MKSGQDETQWACWMREALAGDAAAYRRFLAAVTPALRAMARAGLARAGAPTAEAEDIVQEALLAIHLKRHTWDQEATIAPWIAAIARYKLVDWLRRRGRRAEIVMDEGVIDMLAATPPEDEDQQAEVANLIPALPERASVIVRRIAIEERSIRQVADELAMSEGAVRVALHRALKALAALYRTRNE